MTTNETKGAASGGRSPVSTAPKEPQLPTLGTIGMLRWAWRQLTSMRTALFLLLLISVAAIPGSIFPQRNIDSGKVADYLAQNPTTGPWLDTLGFFDVYQSPWFSAIYLLLFISLLGCIIPRTKVHVKAMRTPPPKAPARPQRLEVNATVTTQLPPEQVLAEAKEFLRSKRFRVHSHDDKSLSAETGYWRETGNLLFHLALTGIIVAMAIGHLFGWRGDVIVTEGDRFASSSENYFTYSAGPLASTDDIPEFVLGLDKLDVAFNDKPGRGFGLPSHFTAKTQYSETPGGPTRPVDISVNHPLRLGDTDVFLLGNGYAPFITVRDPKGEVLFRGAVPFMAQDANYSSVGVVKVSAMEAPKQIGFNAIFMPTAEPTFKDGPISIFPDVKNPELAISIWEGTLFPNGAPQSVYSLNTSEMKQVTKEDGSPLLYRMVPGETREIPGNRGSITFESVQRFAGFSVRSDPGAMPALIFATLATLGLILGLTIKRRRVFVRVLPAKPGRAGESGTDPGSDTGPPATVVAIGGLSKDADSGLAATVAALRDRLDERTPAS